MLRDSIDPRLAGVRMEWIALDAVRGAIVMRIPASLAAPHRVSYHRSGLFYGRNSRGKYPMDAHELWVAFTQAEQLPQKIRQLHETAVTGARGKDMPFALNDEPSAVVSTVPLGFFREVRDLPINYQNVQVPVEPGGSLDYMNVLEGVLWHTPPAENGRVRSFALTHWTGRVDVAWTIGSIREVQGQQKRFVYPGSFEKGLFDAAGSAVTRLRQHGVEGPWVILTSIIDVQGYQLVAGDGYATRPAWKSTAPFAPLIVDQVNPEAMLPLLKAFWLLFGQQRPAGRAIV
jgi:hypothetical protein